MRAKNYTGRPCKHGHGGLRYKSSGACVECVRLGGARWYAETMHCPKRKAVFVSKHRLRRGATEPTRPCPDVCESCGDPPGRRALDMDHCHQSGRFRGWLCNPCNMGIGHFKDDSTRLKSAIEYLRRST